ncbi:hypothetical protein [Pedobacter frigoris]|uniref:Tetratricopeptide repeat protein n=1 Tax=Pedobacter frigoris TaxID=2571272 RepID=A0A4U1CMI7_9SPHI|nr:hypothetical protein [Pedobacter frigoris]TKC07591.1 hypothetical protein FA047_10145 [Pedobacter frigoris]
MEQQTDIRQQLAELIAEPGKVSQRDTPMLNELAMLYPYFQPIHLLAAKAALGTNDANAYLANAALYTNGQLLHNFVQGELRSSREFNVVMQATFGTDASQPEALDEVAIDEVQAETTEKPTADEQETFEEIGEVNINEFRQEQRAESELVLENIVATDFFAFQDNFKVEPATEELVEPEPLESEETVISKYDDDKLPYTFLWWLAKTRKEHQQIFQPYASPKRQEAPAEQQQPLRQSELQQQYVEHIFHMQSPFNEEETDYVPSHFKRHNKGDEIIESFIKNEPQISPPKPEQINNENKAKKSAEDHNDLVSETLAKIYIEQMLYDKAIETYEKLSLKFPEKSRYFADLIQSIEKKI